MATLFNLEIRRNENPSKAPRKKLQPKLNYDAICLRNNKKIYALGNDLLVVTTMYAINYLSATRLSIVEGVFLCAYSEI